MDWKVERVNSAGELSKDNYVEEKVTKSLNSSKRVKLQIHVMLLITKYLYN